ncbi:MAG: hypothetical protein ACON4T_09320 [Synechococcus sp.]
MNSLALIKQQQLKAQSLKAAQKVFATASEAKGYTAAHQASVTVTQRSA